MSDFSKFLNYHNIPYNSIFTVVMKYPQGLNRKHWSLHTLSRNSNLPWKLVEENPDGLGGKSWNMKGLSLNLNLDWDYVKKHPKGLKIKRKISQKEIIIKDGM